MRDARDFSYIQSQTRDFIASSEQIAQLTRMERDSTDNRLLLALQSDAQTTSEKLGQMLDLSASQVGRRRQRLEAAGVITGYRAQLDPEALGLGVQAFVQVQMASHSKETAREFATLLDTRREIVAAWTLTGEADYLLRVYCSDLRELHRLVHDVLLPHHGVARVQSQIVMHEPKRDAPLPT